MWGPAIIRGGKEWRCGVGWLILADTLPMLHTAMGLTSEPEESPWGRLGVVHEALEREELFDTAAGVAHGHLEWR